MNAEDVGNSGICKTEIRAEESAQTDPLLNVLAFMIFSFFWLVPRELIGDMAKHYFPCFIDYYDCVTVQ